MRTAFLSDDDTTDVIQPSTVLAKLCIYGLLSANSGMNPDAFALPVMADRARDDTSFDMVRTTFNS